MSDDYTHDFVEVSGCKTELYRGGSGAPLLFLHGAGGNLSWMPFMAELAKDFEVIAPSHPGWGRTETPDWIDKIDDIAYFYLDFLEALDLSGVHLVGNSMGGWIASEIAVRSQERLKSLTLISPAGVLVPDVPMGDIFLWSREETARNLFHDQSFAEARLSMPMDEELQDIALKNHFATARVAWQPRLHNPVLRKWMHRIKLPTAIVWGDKDTIFPEPYAHEFKTLIPHANLFVYKDCGHLPQIERMEDFVSAVKDLAQAA